MSALTQTPATRSTATGQDIGGNVQKYEWTWQEQTFTVVYETKGEGTPVLLLPAFSTVSTRAEMRGLAEKLTTQHQVVALDWLGFGQSDRPPLDYEPTIYHQLLQDFVRDTFSHPIAVVAAGHAAGYVMQLAQQSDVWSRIVLVAPTWRGPFTVMGASKPVAGMVRELVRSPLLGQALYQANTTPAFLRFMYGRHVYVDKARLTPEFIQQKRQITQHSGARFAPAAFVTGRLDPVTSRTDFLQLFQVSLPIMVIVGSQAPPSSTAEMEAVAAVPGIQTQTLPGTLGLHEEYAAEVAEVVLPFLNS
ncbi:alpha/beta hydrolase [Gloeocapsopsis sp. IPPAS B-1203]|uniref:alpha/beta fold hydrolase n=1 Tax=Gloeocapsopsis sp. IPPAS B-1203 TaxID=2049454 RepID=UPI000C19C2CA|nr:alpha/beta hydrolase [Gloeocapsopsis sp. IPPAS B-1203]PIG91188.1 alpha/beta hydrolase [Gloeocapsopsis sp. IPPAS B-1203]